MDNNLGPNTNHELRVEQNLSADLEDSYRVEIPDFSGQQRAMLGIFMFLQAFLTILTVSINPIMAKTIKAYELKDYVIHMFSGLAGTACLLGFFPFTSLIASSGIKIGLIICLVGTLIGSILCTLIGVNFYIYLVGYFIMILSLQGVHAAKGYFINMYYDEKAVVLPN